MPYINRRFTDFRRFPCSISVKSIVVVMSQMRDATRKFAIAIHEEKLCDQFWKYALSSAFLRRCNVDKCFLKSGRCLIGIVSEPTKFERIHQLPRYTSSSSFCGNMGVVCVRQPVHLKDDFFRATQFDHSPF